MSEDPHSPSDGGGGGLVPPRPRFLIDTENMPDTRDGSGNAIGIGSFVRSYDRPDSEADYVEGWVVGWLNQRHRDSYAIRVTRSVQGDDDHRGCEHMPPMAYPPVNGTPEADDQVSRVVFVVEPHDGAVPFTPLSDRTKEAIRRVSERANETAARKAAGLDS